MASLPAEPGPVGTRTTSHWMSGPSLKDKCKGHFTWVCSFRGHRGEVGHSELLGGRAVHWQQASYRLQRRLPVAEGPWAGGSRVRRLPSGPKGKTDSG